MGWLDPQLFRRAAAMLYGGSSEASPEPYKDAGKSHWQKVVVSILPSAPPAVISAVRGRLKLRTARTCI